MRIPRKRPILRYSVSIILLAVAFGVDVIVRNYFGKNVLFLPLTATTLAALFGGYGPGAFATVLSAIGIGVFLLNPHGSFLANTARILLFIPAGLLLTWVSATLKASKELAEQANAELLAERALREKFQLMLTHDLRNPLTAAHANIELILRHPEQSDLVKPSLRAASAALARADNMIQELLDANRIHAGHALPVHLRLCDLVQLVRETESELAIRYGQRFDFNADSARCQGNWDYLGVKRIVENLATNAIKYGSIGTKITLAIKTSDTAVALSVHNLGKPIPKDELPNLFEMFYKTRSVGHGWGIGLSFVKGMAEANGGTVSVKSNNIEGTTFTVTLPLPQNSRQTA